MAKAATKAKKPAKAKAEKRPVVAGYTDEEKAEVAAHVIVNVACGRFVSRIFREDQTTASGVKLPARETFWRWVLEDESGEWDNKLTRARERGIEALLDECAEIADDTANDTILSERGNFVPNSEWIARSRVRIETRIKLAQMMKPKKYGPKLDLTSGGEKLPDLDPVARATRLASIFTDIEKRRGGEE